jgi:hypothetical protein
MRKANIQPVTVVDKTADKLGAKVNYDLLGHYLETLNFILESGKLPRKF